MKNSQRKFKVGDRVRWLDGLDINKEVRIKGRIISATHYSHTVLWDDGQTSTIGFDTRGIDRVEDVKTRKGNKNVH